MKFKKVTMSEAVNKGRTALREAKADDAFAMLDNPEYAEYHETDYSEQEKKLARFLEQRANFEPLENPNEITDALDDCLRSVIYAKSAGRGTAGSESNLLLVGRAGHGKTSIVKQWCRARHINFVEKDASAFDPVDFSGVPIRAHDEDGNPLDKLKRVPNTEFDQLDYPASILFLDEINFANPALVPGLLKFTLNHELRDSTEPNGVRYFPNFLFTVAAMNPSKMGYEGTKMLNMAQQNRMKVIQNIEQDPKVWRRWFLGSLKKDLDNFDKQLKANPSDDFIKDKFVQAYGKLELAKKLTGSRYFKFDPPNVEEEAIRRNAMGENVQVCSPRQVEAAIQASEGKKDKLLQNWERLCGPMSYGMVESILADYTDVDDKANRALKKYMSKMDPDDRYADIPDVGNSDAPAEDDATVFQGLADGLLDKMKDFEL